MARVVSTSAMVDDPPREGVLVVRAWVEDHPSAALRAVVTETTDPSGTEPASTVTTASVDEVCRLVREWLTDLVGE